jgi:transcriptional regulator with XRE-family HTH domain
MIGCCTSDALVVHHVRPTWLNALVREGIQTVTPIGQWTGHEARALRRALRLSVRTFADHLGVAVRTVAKWEAGGAAVCPRPDSQAILDTALERADDEAKARFALLAGITASPPTEPEPRNGYHLPTSTAYDSWTDDLERAVICLSRQDFRFATILIERWLKRVERQRLDEYGVYLHARSLTLLGDAQRDQGVIVGPLSASSAYRQAHQRYARLDLPRRAAQVELSLTIVAEMSGKLELSAGQYRELADDERLDGRDRARARLWVGTALTKARQYEPAISAIATATQDFETLEEPEDWSVAHQKLALAYLAAGDLNRAAQYIDIALVNRLRESPLQQVRLDTAYAHILLSDRGTREEGSTVLNRAEQMAVRYGLSHQLQSIERIGQLAQT